VTFAPNGTNFTNEELKDQRVESKEPGGWARLLFLGADLSGAGDNQPKQDVGQEAGQPAGQKQNQEQQAEPEGANAIKVAQAAAHPSHNTVLPS